MPIRMAPTTIGRSQRDPSSVPSLPQPEQQPLLPADRHLEVVQAVEQLGCARAHPGRLVSVWARLRVLQQPLRGRRERIVVARGHQRLPASNPRWYRVHQRQEFLSREVQPFPNRGDRDPLDARDLFARQAVQLEQHEGGPPVRVHLRQKREKDALALLAFQQGGRAGAVVGHGVQSVCVLSREDVLDPGASPEVTDLTLGDAVQPGGGIFAVEGMQPPTNDQEHVLGDVFPVRLRDAQSPNPPEHVLEPRIVDCVEGSARRHRRARVRWGRAPPQCAGRDGRRGHHPSIRAVRGRPFPEKRQPRCEKRSRHEIDGVPRQPPAAPDGSDMFAR